MLLVQGRVSSSIVDFWKARLPGLATTRAMYEWTWEWEVPGSCCLGAGVGLGQRGVSRSGRRSSEALAADFSLDAELLQLLA